ncbi:unannotated protein [freshwater metagenome]|uniref:Unannotated protein n=1 Tax=freshwater metagenome TaxID=449393 RepID=A0A6J6W1G4_9ZZZZ
MVIDVAQNVLTNRAMGFEFIDLTHPTQAQTTGARHAPTVGLLEAFHQAQQCGLAPTIAPHDADPIADVNTERDLI